MAACAPPPKMMSGQLRVRFPRATIARPVKIASIPRARMYRQVSSASSVAPPRVATIANRVIDPKQQAANAASRLAVRTDSPAGAGDRGIVAGSEGAEGRAALTGPGARGAP